MTEFFVESGKNTEAAIKPHRALDVLTDPSQLVRSGPHFQGMYDHLADMRLHNDDSCKSEWKHVATIQGPVLDVARLLEPDFTKNKKQFYGWLDRNPQYCAYDRRKNKRANLFHGFDGGTNGGVSELR